MNATVGGKIPDEIDRLCQYIDKELGDQTSWEPWPGGWPGEIATALIDAVYSARAQYRTRHGKGIHALVSAWREHRSAEERDSLQFIETEIGPNHPTALEWATAFGSTSPAPSRRSRRPDDPLKAAAVREASGRLRSIGIDHAGDVTVDRRDDALRELKAVPGIGDATSSYFLMLLGHPGVKPDVMIHRFLTAATGRTQSNRKAVELVFATASRFDARPVDLEHAIWAHGSQSLHRNS